MSTTLVPETPADSYTQNSAHARVVLMAFDELDALLVSDPKAFVAAARKLSAPPNGEDGGSSLLDDRVARNQLYTAAGYVSDHLMRSDETFLRIAGELVITARKLTIHNLKHTGRFRDSFPAAPK